MFALVDANSFYCSAEQVFRPDWRGKPVIVLSNNDGMIVAANRQAKEAGIGKFLPYFQVKALCAKRGVIVCSSNYELYADLSSKMMDIIGRFAPEQHVYSIDESFLSFKNCYPAIKCLLTQGQLIRRAVWKEARLAVCVGIGETLTLAKIANHAAKKIEGYQGVCFISNELERIAILKQLAVGDVWGIGSRISKKLELMNIHTAFQLASMPPTLARKQFSIEIERTVRELNGQACKVWDEARADKKQIFSTRSVGERIADFDSLLQALSKHVGIAASKARKQGSSCKTMLLFASNSPFDERPVSYKAIVHFPCPTNCTVELTKAMSEAAPKLFRDGVHYYKIGIGLIDLASEQNSQFDLFNPPTAKPALMLALDHINQRYGSDTVFLAAQGIEHKWAMRRDLLTPQYTTKWLSVPRIKC
ncbi:MULTISPECIES: Y-family DNA polymerase [Shewanella]|uniref:Y-family DNA polymerase n=2 Tax=Shewanellaceae TaxID=267890 RepID=UPI000F50830B|nr:MULTISPECIES: Y-family DNA polymerase [Shewanella]NCO71587.1 Y-family DNA polymerase [Shewanella vesiculosa]NCP73462.1 Y-family DNA polymerase [Shewanella vesiculosa]NCP92485.1 Y-family DNA polymerase [Shewanella vesiculosa]NCP99440.1 Y-family DNA polymerase [Shewanella vesiculosa]NCQ44455.1 Y-family DNA polymerase [Shewanella frigidimarina]